MKRRGTQFSHLSVVPPLAAEPPAPDWSGGLPSGMSIRERNRQADAAFTTKPKLTVVK